MKLVARNTDDVEQRKSFRHPNKVQTQDVNVPCRPFLLVAYTVYVHSGDSAKSAEFSYSKRSDENGKSLGYSSISITSVGTVQLVGVSGLKFSNRQTREDVRSWCERKWGGLPTQLTSGEASI